MGGVGVGAAAGVPGADADIRQQVGQGLAQGGQRPVIVAVVVPSAYGGGIRQPVVDHGVGAELEVGAPIRVADGRQYIQV